MVVDKTDRLFGWWWCGVCRGREGEWMAEMDGMTYQTGAANKQSLVQLRVQRIDGPNGWQQPACRLGDKMTRLMYIWHGWLGDDKESKRTRTKKTHGPPVLPCVFNDHCCKCDGSSTASTVNTSFTRVSATRPHYLPWHLCIMDNLSSTYYQASYRVTSYRITSYITTSHVMTYRTCYIPPMGSPPLGEPAR